MSYFCCHRILTSLLLCVLWNEGKSGELQRNSFVPEVPIYQIGTNVNFYWTINPAHLITSSKPINVRKLNTYSAWSIDYISWDYVER